MSIHPPRNLIHIIKERLLHRLNPALLIVLALCLIAAWSFLSRPSLPRETDLELHVFRAVELGYSLRQGVIYPRWAPDFYYGYGYPIFHYYAPLTYYLANLLSLAIPGGAVFGIKTVMVITYLAGGLGVYNLSRTSVGVEGGILAVSSYLFAPYVFLIDPHLRGSVAEFLSLGTGPLAFWGVSLALQERSRRGILLATLGTASLILSHNLMGLITFGLLTAYVLWIGAIGPLLDTWSLSLSTLFVGGGVLAVAVMITAFYWLPVALEADAVQLGNLVGPGHFDFRNHFVSVKELFGASLPLDLGAANPDFRFNLGLAQWALAGSGLVLGIVHIKDAPSQTTRSKASTRTLPVFWGLSATALVFLILPFSLPVWELLPGAAFVQFPWRLLGPASFCLAMLGGYAIHSVSFIAVRKRWLSTGLVLLPLFFSLPIFIPPRWGNFGAANKAEILIFELNGIALGTTSAGDYLPRQVSTVPAPQESMIEAIQQGETPDRVNRTTLPAGTNVNLIRENATQALYAIDTPEPFTLRLYQFMFPGWRATLDGEPVAIEVAEPEGFVTISIPPGEHILRIWLGQTPVRIAGVIIALIGIATLAGASFATGGVVENNSIHANGNLHHISIGIIGFAAVAMVGGAAGLFQPDSPPGTALPSDHQTISYFQGGANLIGYDISPVQPLPGDLVTVTLYWYAREPIYGNFQVFTHLTTLSSHTWAQSDKLNPGDYPTSRWPTDRYVRDEHHFVIPYGTPPGRYVIRVGLWDFTTGVRQLVLEPDGTILGDTVSLETPLLLESITPASRLDALDIAVPINLTFVEGITLLGVSLFPNSEFDQPVGNLVLNLYWLAEKTIDADYETYYRLLNEGGEVVQENEEIITDGNHPTSLWVEGEIVRDLHPFWIDEAIPPGLYIIQIGLKKMGDNSTIVRWVPVTTFQRR